MARRNKSKEQPDAELNSEVSAAGTAPPARPKALVFISHDSRDADLAEAFANLLLDVSGGTLKSFRSSDKKGNSGIEFGAEWYTAIMSQLADATDVVALLTSRSVDRPWILYEAGVAKGKLETTVFGVALGVPLEKVSTGPFGQFQNCGGDEDSLTKLVMQLMQKNPDAAPRDEAVRMQVKLFGQKVDEALKSRGNKDVSGSKAPEEENVAKLFEEVKAMVRELPERFDDRLGMSSRRGPNKRLRRHNQMMLEDMVFSRPFGDVEDGGALNLMIVLAMLRDDYPWLYEAGLQFQSALQSGNKAKIKNSRAQMHHFIEHTLHGPMREFAPDDKDSSFALHRLHDFIERVAEHAENEVDQRKPRRKII